MFLARGRLPRVPSGDVMGAGRCFLVATLLAVGGVQVAGAATINVPGDQPTIQAGIDAAAGGDTVLVAPGTYDEAIDFTGKAISVQSSGGAAVTTIHPPTLVTAVTVGGSGATIALRGFTVRGAARTGSTSFAGNVDAFASAGVIEQNVLTGAYSCEAPGIVASGPVTVRHNVIWGNRHECSGGGLVSIVEIYGGAVFSDNLVVDNNYGNSPVGVATSGVVTRNIIAGNSAVEGGGAIVSGGEFSNNLVVGNTGATTGGVRIDGFGGLGGTIVNNTFVDNYGNSTHEIWARLTAGATGYVVRNNIFDNVGGPLLFCDPTYSSVVPTFDANNFMSPVGPIARPGSSCADPTGGTGNIGVDSGFVDPFRGDFHLAVGSPLIDAGTATAAPTTDGDGDPRPLDGSAGPAGAQWDIGLDEAADAGNAVETVITGGPEVAVGAVVPPFTFTSSTPGATFECDVDMAGFVPCTAPFPVQAGEVRIHSFRVRAKSGSGQIDRTPATRLYTVDLTPPNTTIGAPPAGVPSSPFWAVSFLSDDPNATFECAVDGTAFGACGSPFQMSVGLGAHTVAVQAIDLAGNTDPSPATTTWTADCTLFGSPLDEILLGSTENDGLCADAGLDALYGFDGADVLSGGDSDDVLSGGPGADSIHGGDGIDDVVDYSERTTPVAVVLGDGLSDGGAEDGSGDAIDPSVEDIWGGSAGDSLTGDQGDNIIDGGLGGDTLHGGAGTDFVDYSSATTPVTADLDGAAGDDGRAGEGDTIGADVEAIIGGEAGDTLSGGPDANFLDGGPGDDTIITADGVRDVIDCGPGSDVVYVDPVDAIFGCETRHDGPPPGPTGAPPSTPAPPSILAGPHVPVSSVRVHRLELVAGATGTSQAGLSIPVRCRSSQSRSCRIRLTATATVRIGNRSRTYVVGRAQRTVTQGVVTRVTLRLNQQAARLFPTRARLRVTIYGALVSGGAFRPSGRRTLVVKRVAATARSRAAKARALHHAVALRDGRHVVTTSSGAIGLARAFGSAHR